MQVLVGSPASGYIATKNGLTSPTEKTNSTHHRQCSQCSQRERHAARMPQLCILDQCLTFFHSARTCEVGAHPQFVRLSTLLRLRVYVARDLLCAEEVLMRVATMFVLADDSSCAHQTPVLSIGSVHKCHHVQFGVDTRRNA